MFSFRNITGATNARTTIATLLGTSAMNEGGPLVHTDFIEWLHAFRDVTGATNERTLVSGGLPNSALGHTAPSIHYEYGRAVSSALVLANMNSIPLDWAARLSVGGNHMSFCVLKQLPVLPPGAYLKEAVPGHLCVTLIIPRVLELTYTSEEMAGFAKDLGFQGKPFPWNEDRRHCLQSELDAVFAHMYGLDRADLEWILDASPPSSSFPTLKKNELEKFGEYRTQRYVLQAYDMLQRGHMPNLHSDLQ